MVLRRFIEFLLLRYNRTCRWEFISSLYKPLKQAVSSILLRIFSHDRLEAPIADKEGLKKIPRPSGYAETSKLRTHRLKEDI